MNLKTCFGFAMAGATMSIAGFAQADQALEQRVKQLESQLTQLKGQQESTWLNERRAEEVKSLVREVLADADTRATLMEDGMSAGHDGKNFFLRSADGGFSMKIKGQIQFRYIFNDRSESGSDDQEFGFNLRRTKLEFAGHVADPRITYAIRFAVDRGDNTVSADKIRLGYEFDNGFYVWGGEDKGPFLREELTSSSMQLAVERSLFNETFTIDKVQGIAVGYKADMFRVEAMIHDGAGSGDGSGSNNYGTLAGGFDNADSKDFDDDDNDFAFAARVDVRIAGDWDQQKDFTSWAGEDMALFVGAAMNYETSETGDATANDKIFAWTIDGQFEMGGLNVFAAVAMASTDLDAGAGDTDPWGVVLQAGYNFDLGGNQIEPFVRYEHIDADTGGNDEFDVITFGANYYLNKHNAKITVDVVYGLDPIASGLSNSGAGILADATDEDGQLAIRAQFQLLF